ncbi:class I SAM-dependent methyltransferase [Streptomyces olivaceus]|uniref:class I SAM-dependent methyltransferase n=1 Tax=Streptomyces olivaceus TaxID=47716 RepID=UPI001CCE6237|nr:class I SAM-dependent methyltransferase [Streptomyces olivaceus]MBZ6085295.1 class I SAM-dependent methyltransferase [Streptomyces olivaceus]
MNEFTRQIHAVSDAARFWEHLYRGKDGIWKNTANPLLAETAAHLPPGRALDLGCGEGGDTLWLATHGWHVTAVDIAPTALHRTAQLAADNGVEERVETQQYDLAAEFPGGAFDLISAQYLQTPYALPRAEILRRAAHQLTTGGILLIVDHGSVRPWAWNTDPDTHFPSPENIYDELDLDTGQWIPQRLATPQRVATGPDGQTATVTDTVVAVRRIA